MTNLVSAYQNNDINEFEKILKTNRRNIMDDLFIREHIEGEFEALATWSELVPPPTLGGDTLIYCKKQWPKQSGKYRVDFLVIVYGVFSFFVFLFLRKK